MSCIDCPYIGQLIVDLNTNNLCMIVGLRSHQFSNFDAYEFLIYDIREFKVYKVPAGRRDLLIGFRHWLADE